MDYLKELQKIKRLYREGKNIMEYLRDKSSSSQNSPEAILISYDLQSGSYTKFVNDNPEFNYNYTKALAKVISSLGVANSILEAGVGEATTLANVVTKLGIKPKNVLGFDISWSRIMYAREYVQNKGVINYSLFTGDLFNIPLRENSVDIVYTSHSIEPNGGREKEALEELYRITNKYLILLEPSFEFANDAGKERMIKHGYVKNLRKVAEELGYKVIEHKLFEYSANPLNPTGLIVIEKQNSSSIHEDFFACPVTKTSMNKMQDCFFCQESLLAYPIIMGIPCLLPQNAIVATHFNYDRISKR